MLHSVNNCPRPKGMNMLLMTAYNRITPMPPPEAGQRCRFDMFVKLRSGVPHFPGVKRTWCFRGDKYTDKPHQMLRKLLNHLIKKISDYEVIEIYDNDAHLTERIILKIQDGVIDLEKNQLKKYSLMLQNYPLPEWLQL